MRIIHVIDSSESSFSANERQALALVIAQKKHGLSPIIITGGEGPSPRPAVTSISRP